MLPIDDDDFVCMAMAYELVVNKYTIHFSLSKGGFIFIKINLNFKKYACKNIQLERNLFILKS